MALHGVSSGKFDIESPADKFFKSITDDKDSPFYIIPEEKKTVMIGMNGWLVSESCKTVKGTITVTPKEDKAEGSHVAWTVEFEKIRHDIDDPQFIIDVLVSYLKETDESLNL